MYTLIINDDFSINVNKFSEEIDSDGRLRLVINEQLPKINDYAKTEIMLISLKSYFIEDSISNLTIIDNGLNQTLLNTYLFTSVELASLFFDEMEYATLNIVFS